MLNSRHIIIATLLMSAVGLSQAQTPMYPPAGTATTASQPNDPLVQKREADAQAKAAYKEDKKAAKANYKNDKKAAKARLKKEKAATAAERKEKLQADPIIRPTP